MAELGSKILPINIVGAKVTGIHFGFEDDELKWSAEVCLLMEDNKRLTSISVGNNTWEESKKAKLDIEGYELAGKLRQIVETAVTRHLNALNQTIEHKGSEG